MTAIRLRSSLLGQHSCPPKQLRDLLNELWYVSISGFPNRFGFDVVIFMRQSISHRNNAVCLWQLQAQFWSACKRAFYGLAQQFEEAFDCEVAHSLEIIIFRIPRIRIKRNFRAELEEIRQRIDSALMQGQLDASPRPSDESVASCASLR